MYAQRIGGTEMNDTWEARFVDNQMDRAWLDLRMRLADRFAAGLANGGFEPIDISSATGETLTVTVDDEYVVVVAGDDVYTTDNVDEAAYTVFRVLHDEWQVVHPVFLDTELVEVPAIDDNPVRVVAPVLGKAASKEQLQGWVVAAFSEGRSEPIKVDRNGDVAWRTHGGNRVSVKVRNPGRIELLAVLGRNVGFNKARKVIDELSRKYFGLKFFFVQDTLVMSQIVIAHPFSGEQLQAALRTFLANTDELGWVADKVLRNRVKVERAKVEEAEQARADAEAALAGAERRVEAAERTAARRKLERTWVSRNLARAKDERDAARAELEGLKTLLEKALGHQAFQSRAEHDGAA